MRSVALVLLFLLLAPMAWAPTAWATTPKLVAPPDSEASLSGTVSDADRTMRGFVGLKSHDLIVKWLRANPHRDLTLHLDSGGGQAFYGIKLFDAMQSHGHVSTTVDLDQSCLSACGYLWLAGNARTVADRAVLGFHSAFCTATCDLRGVGTVNQSLLDILARTEPDLAVAVSRTGAMISGNRLIALARRENGRWAMRIFQPPP